MGGFSFPGGVRRTPISRRGQPRGQPGFEIGLSSLGRADGEVVPVDGVEARRVLRVDIDPAREVLVGVANDRCTARGVTSCAGSGSAAKATPALGVRTSALFAKTADRGGSRNARVIRQRSGPPSPEPSGIP